MDRRHLLKAIAALGASSVPVASPAQPRPKRPFRLGFVSGTPSSPQFREAFTTRMRELGWKEEDYVILASAQPLTDLAQLSEDVSTFLTQKLDLLVVGSTAGAVAAQRLTKSLPIVMLASGYPVEAGIANSLARPGRNVTGVAIYAGTGVWGKLLELLRESKPGVKRVGILWGYVPPMFPAAEIEPAFDEFTRSARSLGLSIRIEQAPSRDAMAGAFETLAADIPDALYVTGWLTAGPGWLRLVDYTVQRRLPTITDFESPILQEGPRPLLGYVPDLPELWRSAIGYVDRILKGANPADLPIQLPAKFVFTVNLKTAAAIGLKLPQSILLRADRVIE